MAGGSWLPKVIVVFALLFRINYAHFDDLLDRVRLSKSNDPEVRDFLKSVLKHHGDFRWISHEASKINHDDQSLLPLHGVSPKNKRSFYSSASGGYPLTRKYGYRFENEPALQQQQASKPEFANTNSQHETQPTQQEYAEDFDGPVNDVYPYRDDLNVPQADRRFARETQDSFLYDERHMDENDDFLDEVGPDANDVAEFVSEDRPVSNSQHLELDYTESQRVSEWKKRAATTEQLLNEKLMLHSLLHKDIDDSDRYNRNDMKSNTNNPPKKQLNQLAFHMPGDAIEVIPGSDKGVRYAPGTKYEKFGEFVKSEQEQYEDQPANHNLIKRKCSETLQEHDFRVPELFGPNASSAAAVDVPIAEFYYSLPHDVLGMNQDSINEQRDTFNLTCRKYKRAAHWEKGVKGARKRKAIKIKIFDDGQIVKDIQKGDGVNSIVLTIKNNNRAERHSTITPNDLSRFTNRADYNSDPESGYKYFNALNMYSHNLVSNYPTHEETIASKDDTLQKIDTILQHDEASLKLNSPFPQLSKQHKQTEDDFVNAISHQKNEKQQGQHTSKKYQRINEMGTSVIPLASYKSKLAKSSRTSYSAEDVKQNRLEDQTEPTSAAEQRELGRLNNKFNTHPINLQTSTEKVIVIPLKKSAHGSSSHKHGRDRETFADDRNMATRVMIDNKLKESEDVLGKLRNDLEQSLKEMDESCDSKHLIQSIKNEKVVNKGIDDKEKRSNGDAKKLQSPKAVSFRSRKLFALESDTNEDAISGVSPINDALNAEDESGESLDRARKDIRKVIGMGNDEDYSEDKTDFYESDDKKSPNDKASKPNGGHIKKLFFGNLISSTQEKKALKSRLARTKQSKTKKEIAKDAQYVVNFVAPTDEEEISSLAKRDNYQHLIVKDHDADGKTVRKTETKEEDNPEDDNARHVAGDRTSDRCCQNDPKGNSTCSSNSGGFGSCTGGKTDDVMPSHDGNAGSGKTGNELDIIEKTQAIMLHITGSSIGEPVTSRGELDDSDDPGTKVKDNSALTVKRLNLYKINDKSDKNPEDVVSEIMKLVQTYKTRVDQNSKDNDGDSKVKMSEPTSGKDGKKKKIHTDNSSTLQTTTSDYKENIDNSDKINGDDEEDVALHAHAHAHAKKLHPVKANTCDIKPATDVIQSNPEKATKRLDEDQEFVVPSVVKEGYAKPDVVADGESSDVDNLTEEPHVDEDIKKTQKRDQHIQDNPNKFTPDNIDSFKGIIEAAKETKEAERDAGSNSINIHDSRVKRDIENEYTEDELDKLLSMVDDASDSMKHDHSARHRRYKNYEPFYFESMPRYRQVSNPNPESSTASSVDVSTAAKAAGKDEPTSSMPSHPVSADLSKMSGVTGRSPAPKCGELEYKEADVEAKKKKAKKKSHKCTLNEVDEYGDTCSAQEGPKKTKSQMANENKIRERTRDKIYQDKLVEKQKEQEHIKNVLNGHLVLELMDKFQNRVKENERLSKRFGQAMGKKCANDEVNLLDQFREEQSKADIRHAQLMLHQVIVMMNRIVAEQVHRRTCLILSPSLKNYLKRTAGSKTQGGKSMVVAEGYPLPAVKGVASQSKDSRVDDKQGDFLFPSADEEDVAVSGVDAAVAMRKKINMIRALLNKYNHLSRNCQVKVEPVREYLIQHLKSLDSMYKAKQYDAPTDVCEAKCLHSDVNAPPASSGPSSTSAMVTTAGGPGTKEAESAKPTTVPNPAARSANDPFVFKRDNSIFEDDSYKMNVHKKNGFLSDKYKKLVEAAATFRRKREIEERLARLFGHNKEEVEETTNQLDNNIESDELSNVAFEAPMVYSLH